MEDMARAEYPALLTNLQPAQAVQTLNDRLKRINRVNSEIADWLQDRNWLTGQQERRRVEDQYIAGLRKLAQFRTPNAQSELGVFQTPWGKITDAVERIAASHQLFADSVDRDIEQPLRTFQNRQDVQNMNNIANNLGLMAKDLEDAQDKTDKLSKKGGKASAQKVDAASSKLETATQQWDSQAPFIFETLQALDESRVNTLRELLTQYQTFESEQAQRSQDVAVDTLAQMLEISTEREVQNFVRKISSGKVQVPPRTATTRRTSTMGTQSSFGGASSIPSTPNPTSQPPEDDVSEHNSLPNDGKPESKLRRLGTMFGGRRRQSVHAGFGTLSPQKPPSTTFGRIGSSHGLGSSHGRALSPRASSTNLNETHRLSILPETPDPQRRPETQGTPTTRLPVNGTNGTALSDSLLDKPTPEIPAPTVNGTHDVDLSAVEPPPGPPPSQQPEPAAQELKDEEGFTIRAPMHDPISEAQREAAADEPDQLLKLNIQNKPVDEEDPEATMAALSSVANSLKMGPATRRSVTVRGRRDARNTIYAPAPASITESQSDGAATSPASTPVLGSGLMPTIPASPKSPSRPAAVAALVSEVSAGGTSDTQSVRSGNSLGSFAHPRHPDLTGPGLNASIIETVSAIFEGGVIKSTSIIGEIAFVNNSTGDSENTKSHEIIRINDFSKLERVGPNRIFVHNSSPDQADQFTIDTSHLQKTSTAFSYRVSPAEAENSPLAAHAPLILNAAWKPQGDKLGLLLQYHLNPDSKLVAPVTLQNVVIVATYEGRASGAQTKPSGTHLKDKHLIYWRLGELTLTETPHKIVCRIVGAEGTEPAPGHIEARWEYVASADEVLGSGISVSKLETKEKDAIESDPFADENPANSNLSLVEQAWVDVPASRRLLSGKYEGK